MPAFVFPQDLGSNTYSRSMTSENTDSPFHFIHFNIFQIKNNTLSLNLNNEIMTVEGKKLSEVQGRTGNVNLLTGTSGRALLNADFSRIAGTSYSKESVGEIFLPMPEEVRTNYSSDIASFDAGMISKYVKSLKDGATQSLQDLWNNSNSLFTTGLLATTGAAAANDVYNLMKADEGEAFNPAAEQLFRNMKPRNFSYSYKLHPRNERESKVLEGIIKTLKFHMHPSFKDEAKTYYTLPSLFVITYYSGLKENMKLHRISSCFLEDFNVNYSGAGQYMTFADGQPAHIGLELKFRETVIHTKESINEGY